jgi:hypothetical protein
LEIDGHGEQNAFIIVGNGLLQMLLLVFPNGSAEVFQFAAVHNLAFPDDENFPTGSTKLADV